MNQNLPSDFNFDTSQNQGNLIFIDSTIENHHSLISDASTNSEIIMLDPSRDGVLQITEELAQHSNVDSIHLVSHGESGSIQLGNAELNLDTFNDYADELQSWNSALTSEADLLLYGCNIGSDLAGEDLIDRLASITKADVAASNDLTGSAVLGGDWDLEIASGKIEASLAFSAEARFNYKEVLASEDGTMMMGMQMDGMHMEHQSPLLDLVPHSQATHVAVKNGGWFKSSTWSNGQVPGDEADVLIPKGRQVWYGAKSNARLDTIRVDGTLTFRPNTNSKMLIDTFVVSQNGTLNIGSENNPVRANRTSQIIFTSDTAIDTAADPKQLGRGLISHGQVSINGADKLDFVELAQDLSAGDNQLTLDLPDNMSEPLNWQVGDQLVLGGTDYNRRGSDEDNSRFQDEVLTITAIDGNKISFINNDITSGDNTVLRFDHQRPKGYKDRLNLYVANTTRNVVFETENGDDVPINHRGHVMFMHNPNVVVENAGFYNLGRTDKNKLIDDPGQNVDGTEGNGTNPRGRYALHFHRTGSDDWNGKAAIAKGNAVVGSPGWGIAHHDSYANVEDNVVFDVVGSGIAAEAGNEIGTWRNNITIKTTGDDVRGSDLNPGSRRVNRFDLGFNGDGYWVQGAGQINIIDNIAISASGAGIIHYGGADGGQRVRDAQTIAVSNLPSEYQTIAKGTGNEDFVDVSAVPLRQLSGFESYNSNYGISFWGTIMNLDNQLEIEGAIASSRLPAHNFHSKAENFKVWESRFAGVNFHYASQIDLENGLIVGNKQDPHRRGIGGNSGSKNNDFDNIHIDGFKQGLLVPLDSNNSSNNSLIKNVSFANNTQNFGTKKFNNGVLTGYSAYTQIVNSEFDVPEDNVLPTPKFAYKTVGGLAVEFEASNSFDSDSLEKHLDGKGIVSYGWDFNNDGNVDKFGREISHYFDTSGSKNVALTVWDNQGATQTINKTINVRYTPYDNLIVDGGFNNDFQPIDIANNLQFSSGAANKGWHSNVNWSWDSDLGNGAAVFSTNPYSRRGLGQIIADGGLRRGNQTLSLKATNIEGDRNPNQITVTVWGVDGEFRNSGWKIDGPKQVGAIPMNKSKLLQETIGGSDFDWTNFNWDLNFGSGYQFIVVQLNPKGYNPNNDDLIAIDDIKIAN